MGPEQYAPAFRDNDVDGEVLPELTSDDLISIGVTSVGHRRRLLTAITALRDGPPELRIAARSALGLTIPVEERRCRTAGHLREPSSSPSLRY